MKILNKKKNIILICLILMSVLVSGCTSSEPCKNCKQTPTKAFENMSTDENEYYCKECYSDCEFCRDEAKNYYTSGLGDIMFVCDDCYQDILEFNE